MPAMSIALATKNRNNYKDICYLFRLKEKNRLKETNRLWIFKRFVFQK